MYNLHMETLNQGIPEVNREYQKAPASTHVNRSPYTVHMGRSTLVGASEIAEIAHVRVDTVMKWASQQPDFPEPIEATSWDHWGPGSVPYGRRWEKKAIVAWLERTGRLQ